MAKTKPNILWICTDSQRWDTLGCYGNTFVHSPNIDKLATEGILFNHCYAQNPLCTPSRGAFLTGRYPVTNGLRQNGQDISEHEVLVTRLLAESEDKYTCGLSGKLHLSACNHRFLLGDNWWEKEDPCWTMVERRINDGYADSEFSWDHAPSDRFTKSAFTIWLREQGVKNDTPPREDCPSVLHGLPDKFNQTTWCSDVAVDFIERHKEKENPWLFSVNIFDPHASFRAPDEYFQRYLDMLDDIPLPNYVSGELDNKPPCQKARHLKLNFGSYTEEQDEGDPYEHRMITAAYWAMCDLIDANVGRMMDALERTGQRENTIVIFTSDHGEMLGDHGLYIKGPFLYDSAIRVPLIISCPGTIPQGVVTDAMVELSDLAPTLLDVAGQPRYPGMQTRSLWPLLTGSEPVDTFRDDVYCEYTNSNPDKPKVFLTMVRTLTHKLIAAHGGDDGELYDMVNDPTETKNLWNDPSVADIKMSMLKRLMNRMAQTADPLPDRIGIY